MPWRCTILFQLNGVKHLAVVSVGPLRANFCTNWAYCCRGCGDAFVNVVMIFLFWLLYFHWMLLQRLRSEEWIWFSLSFQSEWHHSTYASWLLYDIVLPRFVLPDPNIPLTNVPRPLVKSVTNDIGANYCMSDVANLKEISFISTWKDGIDGGTCQVTQIAQRTSYNVSRGTQPRIANKWRVIRARWALI